MLQFGLDQFEAPELPFAQRILVVTAASPLRKCTFLCSDPLGWSPLSDTAGLGRCFFQGFFLGVPPLVGLIFCLIEAGRIRSRRTRTRTTLGWRVPVQLALIGIQTCLWLGLAWSQYQKLGTAKEIAVVSALLEATATLPVALLTYLERFMSYKPSSSLLIYWGLLFLSLVMAVWQHAFGPVFTAVIVAVVAAAFGLEWTTERAVGESQFNDPYDQADIFSRLTFTWMTPLMKLGYRHFLTADDLPNLAYADRTELCLTEFQESWNTETTRPKASLTRALFRAFGKRYAIGGACKVVQDIMQFAQPQLLKYLITFVNDYRANKEVSLSRGFYISAAMFGVSIIQTMALHQYFERSFGTGMRIRTALTHAIYRKSLALSGETRAVRTTGDTVNLMSIDTQRLQEVCPNGHNLWSSPLQITLCLVSLYSLVGNSMWIGVIILAVMVPINIQVAKTQKTLQSNQMKYKDLRTRLTSELFSGIKSIKLYAWEGPFTDRLEHARDELELESLKKIGVFRASMSFIWSFTPVLVSASTFAFYTGIQHQPLSTEIVFPALALFNLLSFPMAMFPMLMSSLIEASVATARITDFLVADELQSDAVERLPRVDSLGDTAVQLSGASFVWQRDPVKHSLSNINFKVAKGELACIVGRVGSGKSAILQAVLGNIHKTHGDVKVHGSVAYVAQDPWILNASVRDNILFGCKFDETIYEETISACALRDDLAALPDGDSTHVGEKGISLSGGQKARLSLARAVYARADVYLLDDPLSAVDEHVGGHIIDHVLSQTGLLARKAVILATNSIPVLQIADSISMVANGELVESGPTSSLGALPRISALLEEFGRSPSSSSPPSSASASTSSDEAPRPFTEKRRASMRRPSIASFRPSQPTELRKEHMEQGKVSWQVYAEYARVSGIGAVTVFLANLVATNALSLISNVWLKHWAEVEDADNLRYYLGIYFALGAGSSLLMIMQNLVLWLRINIKSASTLHSKMLKAVIRAPMSFFETTPLGRIVNRFSNDVYRVDQQLAFVFHNLFNNSVKVSFTVALICWNTPVFMFIALPLTVFYFYYQRFYLRTSRELKRLDSVSKSPIYAQFQETLDGVATIRAFDAVPRFFYMNQCFIDTNNKAYFPSISANRWLAVRLEFVGSVVILSAAALSVASLPYSDLSAGLIGLALSYALQVTQSLNWIVRMTVEVETNIVSVERMMEYSQIKPEAPAVTALRPPQHWPDKGVVVFDEYSTRYRPELPLVLKKINLAFRAGEKIGIVGRTGAGKSSLTLALFRLIEAAGGHIAIDNVNTSEIGLQDLRGHLSIIPQDPQLFEGTVRDNLDPAHHASDAELWRVLELSYLRAHIESMDGLDATITEGGSNLSAGQRQLLCLARALLTDTSVLVMDEATAAVDVETDQILQRIIRKEFKERTILTIAHRLNTILDSDRVVVLSAGEVAEVGAPESLLADPSSMFYALAKRGGLV